jgi:hypothetical protein
MGRKKKMRSSVKLTAIKRFEKSRSRRTCPAFQNTTFVFCGDWGGASTSTKLSVSAKAEIGSFRKVGTALHCLPLSCSRFAPFSIIPADKKIEVALQLCKATSIRPV